MSIANEITKAQSNLKDCYDVCKSVDGVVLPEDKNFDNLPALIEQALNSFQKPSDWSDIRVDCPANSIALYAGHERLEQIDYIITNGRLLWANPKIYLNSISTGMNQRYIDTGYVPNQKTNITIKASCAGSSSGIYVPFGQRTDGAYNTSTEQVYLNFAANITMFYGQNKTTSAWETDTVYTLNYTDARTNTSSEYPIYLFNINNKGTNANGYYGNIYFVKFFDENNNLLHHYVPVPQGLEIGEFTCPSNGMFDIVNQQFYGNAGTGTFTYGGADPSNLNIKTSVQYDNLGFTATCIGGYNVFIDGTQYGSTYASGSTCNITWSSLALDTGDDITTPSALKAHKVWIEPATEGNNITAFHCVRIATSGDEAQGVLWAHFNLTNSINLYQGFGRYNYYKQPLMQACTAKNNTLKLSGIDSLFLRATSLTYVPVLDCQNISMTAYGVFYQTSAIKEVRFKNTNFTTMQYLFYVSGIERVKGSLDTPNCATFSGVFQSCYNLKSFPKLNFTSATNANLVLFDDISLEDMVLDASEGVNLTKIGTYATAPRFMGGLKGLRVSNQAPFNNATPPQINVSRTGLDRTALVQLFNDLPYNVGYEVVGSPTITDGVVSNFSDTDNLKLSQTSVKEGNLEMRFEFTTGTDITTGQYLFSWQSNPSGTNRQCGIYIANGRYGIVMREVDDNSHQYTNSGGAVVQANTHYYLKTIFNTEDKSLKVGLSTDDANYTYGIQQTLSNNMCLLNGTEYLPQIGRAMPNNYYWQGSINLNTYIKINDVYWFRGQAAMTKTLSCVGATGTVDLTADDKDIALNKGWSLMLS